MWDHISNLFTEHKYFAVFENDLKYSDALTFSRTASPTPQVFCRVLPRNICFNTCLLLNWYYSRLLLWDIFTIHWWLCWWCWRWWCQWLWWRWWCQKACSCRSQKVRRKSSSQKRRRVFFRWWWRRQQVWLLGAVCYLAH